MGPVVPALISAGASLLGVGANEAMTRRQMKWQSEENEKSRNWSSLEWQRQFNETNDYNTPERQVNRLLEAGINPNAVFGGSTSSSSLGTAPTTPSVGHSAVPTPDYSGVINSGTEAFLKVNQAIKTAAEAKRVEKETGWLDPLMDSQVKMQMAQANNEQAKADWQKLQTDFEKIFGTSHRSKAIERMVADTVNAYASARLADANTKVAEVRKFTEEAQGFLHYANAHLSATQANQINELLNFHKAALTAQANAANASAALSSAQAQTENQLRTLRSGLLENELKFNSDTFYDRVDSVRESLDRSILTNEEVRQALERMKFANGLKEFDYWYGQLLRTISTMTSGVPGRVGPGEFGTIHDAVEPTPGRVSVNGFRP